MLFQVWHLDRTTSVMCWCQAPPPLTILSKGFDATEIDRISSHSLKATLLAYMNSWGSTFEVNEVLGYHVNKEHGSASNYTRDALSSPIRQLVSMLADVHEGKFIPDAPRDHTFPSPDVVMPINQIFEQNLGYSVIDAAECMMGDRTHMGIDEARRANDRIGRMMVVAGVSRAGLVMHLNDTEEYALYHGSMGGWSDEKPGSQGARVIADSSPSSSSSSDDESSSDEEEEQSQALLSSVNETGRMTGPSDQCDTMRVLRHSRTK